MASSLSKSRRSIYETITDKILAAIGSGPGDPIMQQAARRNSLRCELFQNSDQAT